MIRFVRWFEIFFMLLPIKYLMRLFFFSKEFTNCVVMPTIALFLGTGNATPEVPTIILERLFTSPTYGMWYPVDNNAVVSNLPPMVVFPKFSAFYETWQKDLEKRDVTVRLSTELARVVKRDKHGVVVSLKHRTRVEDAHNPVGMDDDAEEWEETYDELVLCVP